MKTEQPITEAEARYVAGQVLAEAKATGFPLSAACLAIGHYLDRNGFELPLSLVGWLASGDALKRKTVH